MTEDILKKIDEDLHILEVEGFQHGYIDTLKALRVAVECLVLSDSHDLKEEDALREIASILGVKE